MTTTMMTNKYAVLLSFDTGHFGSEQARPWLLEKLCSFFMSVDFEDFFADDAAGPLKAERLEEIKAKLAKDPRALQMGMRQYSRWARSCPNLLDFIALQIDGLGSEDDEYWRVWKDAILDIGSDASDHRQLRGLLKRLTAGLARPGVPGCRAVECLSCFVRLVPTLVTSGLFLASLEASFPFWRSSSVAEQLSSFTANALSLAASLDLSLSERVLELIISKAVEMELALDSKDASNPTPLRANDDEERAHFPIVDMDDGCASKLDTTLAHLLRFLNDAATLNPDRFRALALALIRIFDRHVLPASRCSRVPSVLFFACNRDPLVADKFLGYLIAVLFNRDSHVSTSLRTDTSTLVFPASQSTLLVAVCRYVQSLVVNMAAFQQSTCRPLIVSTMELLIWFCARKVEALSLMLEKKQPRQRQGSILAELATDRAILAAAVEALMVIATTHQAAATELFTEQDIKTTLTSILSSQFQIVPACRRSSWELFTVVFPEFNSATDANSCAWDTLLTENSDDGQLPYFRPLSDMTSSTALIPLEWYTNM
jgi:hypothetical protein